MSSDAVLITGVARRVGLHLANTFLERGVPVIGTYRSERPSLDELSGRGAELHHCDFYDEPQVDLLCREIQNRHSGLRAVIHNASDWISEEGGLPPEDVMRRMMQVHVTAPYLINLRLEDLLLNSGADHADIIHVGDYVSSRGSSKHIAYAASKAAQDNLTFSFSARLAPKVKVNSIAPALVAFNEGDDEAYREKARSKSLMRREGGMEEFQRAVDYLMESEYITGRILPLDGGRHLKIA
ncbi:MAG: dihydromonapterin reductase [Xanthomonadales bacterium]|nr:dihydromonapterin reductase [Xanthomonadales bacterium]